jgi:hypothetical protein
MARRVIGLVAALVSNPHLIIFKIIVALCHAKEGLIMSIFKLLDSVKDLMVACGCESKGPAVWKDEYWNPKPKKPFRVRPVQCDGRCGVCNDFYRCQAMQRRR